MTSPPPPRVKGFRDSGGNMRIFSIFSISIISLFLFSIYDKAEAENWEVYFKNKENVFYYDKDSIHYPYDTEGFLRIIKLRNREIVRVWTKVVSTNSGTEVLTLEQVRCSERAIQQIHRHGESTLIDPAPKHITHGSAAEKLLNEVCNLKGKRGSR
jgi:hypothetical protein